MLGEDGVGVTPLWGWGGVLVYVEEPRPHYSGNKPQNKSTGVTLSPNNEANLMHLQRPTSVILSIQSALQLPG